MEALADVSPWLVPFVILVAYLILLVVIIGRGSDIVAAVDRMARTVTILSRSVDAARDAMEDVPAQILAAHDRAMR